MRLLCFQAKHFRWKTHSKTLPEVPHLDAEDEIADTVVIFVQAEASDTAEQHRDSIRRKAVKHIKWLANKRDLKNVVFHSFTHLGGETAEPGFAEPFIQSIADRLNQSGYRVQITPFGYFCEWDLSVYGESLAKVWKEIH
ncbi:MAG TPA: threonyl-tRNA synthetase editing domain-containing protein [Candidatus Binatia bacterium]